MTTLTSRDDRGWLRVNSMPVRHYWYIPRFGDLYRSLCGRLAAVYIVEMASERACCTICWSLREREEQSEHDHHD